MYLLTVNNETSLTALAARAAGASSGNPATVQQVAQSLATANPQVDFTNLKPGLLLIVPTVTGVDPTGLDNRMNPVVDNVIQYLTGGLTQLASRLQNNNSGTAGNLTALSTYLGSAQTDSSNQASLTSLINQMSLRIINTTGQNASWASRFQQAQTQINADLNQLGNSLK
jgi:hypothetical protein